MKVSGSMIVDIAFCTFMISFIRLEAVSGQASNAPSINSR